MTSVLRPPDDEVEAVAFRVVVFFVVVVFLLIFELVVLGLC